MILRDIISGCGTVRVHGDANIDVCAITCDSRKVQQGGLFIAVKGFAGDGHSYIASAVKSGAAAIVYEDEAAAMAAVKAAGAQATQNTTGAQRAKAHGATTPAAPAATGNPTLKSPATGKPALIQVVNSRHAVAIIADNFFDHPSQKLNLVGITGTNGKTTTVTLLYRMFTALGYSCGLLSTIANYVGNKCFEAVNTTSDPITINSLLADMVDAGCEYCFMEVSSIGVEQERVAGLKFKVGIFSNLTHDHLDYHKTFAEYLRCKKLFFDMLPQDAFAITNVDDRNGEIMVQNTKAKVVTYSCRQGADHTAKIMEESFNGMQLRIDGKEVWTSLIGLHNVYNILAVYSAAMVLGADQNEALVAISSLQSAPGRLETIPVGDDICVVIDYAHTPDAMKNVLKTLREIAHKRTLICVFGCGGDRDRTKRPEMGKIAEEMADRIIVTSDNSRTEKTSDIMAEIRGGMGPDGIVKSLFIEDREQAIRTAIMTAPHGSTILLAGKGHETYQIIGTEKRHFDEREIVQQILQETGKQLDDKQKTKPFTRKQ